MDDVISPPHFWSILTVQRSHRPIALSLSPPSHVNPNLFELAHVTYLPNKNIARNSGNPEVSMRSQQNYTLKGHLFISFLIIRSSWYCVILYSAKTAGKVDIGSPVFYSYNSSFSYHTIPGFYSHLVIFFLLMEITYIIWTNFVLMRINEVKLFIIYGKKSWLVSFA